MAMVKDSDVERVQHDGFAVVPGVVDSAEIDILRGALEVVQTSTIRRRGAVYARRNLLAEIPGFGPWSVKAGQPHVKPPIVNRSLLVPIRVF